MGALALASLSYRVPVESFFMCSVCTTYMVDASIWLPISIEICVVCRFAVWHWNNMRSFLINRFRFYYVVHLKPFLSKTIVILHSIQASFSSYSSSQTPSMTMLDHNRPNGLLLLLLTFISNGEFIFTYTRRVAACLPQQLCHSDGRLKADLYRTLLNALMMIV